MAGLFSRRKRNDYHGFAKYSDGPAYSPPPVNQPLNSNKNSASSAAAAALSKYKAPEQRSYVTAHQAYHSNNAAAGRTNSLSGYGQRSNSMRAYTYTPKPSYQPSQGSNRSYSLRSNSLRGSAPPVRTASLTQRSSQPSSRPGVARTNSLTQRSQPVGRSNSLTQNYASQRAGSFTGPLNASAYEGFNEEDEEQDFLGEEVVITTKTTKVVDASGRTRSITTETIRQLPDGSNVVETTTKNISRPTSRSNSRSNSFRANSMTMSQASHQQYNLNKIDEDLQDFDYTYLDHPKAPPKLNQGYQESRNANAYHEPKHDTVFDEPQVNPQASGPSKYNAASHPERYYHAAEPEQLSPASESHQQHHAQTSLQPAFEPPPRPVDNGFVAPPGPRGHSVSPSNSSSPRLKSILKNSPAAAEFAQNYEAEPAKPVNTVNAHEEHFRDAQDSLQLNQRGRHLPPSNASGSIKFVEQVETIMYDGHAATPEEHARAEALRLAKEKQDSINMYEQAMQVAMAKVYGAPQAGTSALTPPQSPPTPSVASPQFNVEELADKKLKNDRKKPTEEGLSSNYVYENHHKSFAMHSLRGDEEPGHLSRHDRAKEEKKRLKDEERERAELLKQAEKEKKLAEKQAEKEDSKRNRKAPKNPLSFLGIKMRRGSSGSTGSSGVSGRRHEKLNEEGSQFSSESGNQVPLAQTEHQPQTSAPLQGDGYAESSQFSHPQQTHIPQQQFAPVAGAAAAPVAAQVSQPTFNHPQQGQYQPQSEIPQAREVAAAPVAAPETSELSSPNSTYTAPTDLSPVSNNVTTQEQRGLNDVVQTEQPAQFERPASQSDVPPRSALRSVDASPNLATTATSPTEDAFVDSNDDFIDVPDEYLDEGTNTGVEQFKIVNRSAPSESPVQHSQPAAAQVSTTQPVPPSVEVPREAIPVDADDSDTSIYADSQEEKALDTNQGFASPDVGNDLPTLVSGSNGHPEVLGLDTKKTEPVRYGTLDPGSPTSNRRAPPADFDAVASDKSVVGVAAPENDMLAERERVNPDIARTSAGALEPAAAAETQFNPQQDVLSPATPPVQQGSFTPQQGYAEQKTDLQQAYQQEPSSPQSNSVLAPGARSPKEVSHVTDQIKASARAVGQHADEKVAATKASGANYSNAYTYANGGATNTQAPVNELAGLGLSDGQGTGIGETSAYQKGFEAGVNDTVGSTGGSSAQNGYGETQAYGGYASPTERAAQANPTVGGPEYVGDSTVADTTGQTEDFAETALPESDGTSKRKKRKSFKFKKINWIDKYFVNSYGPKQPKEVK